MAKHAAREGSRVRTAIGVGLAAGALLLFAPAGVALASTGGGGGVCTLGGPGCNKTDSAGTSGDSPDTKPMHASKGCDHESDDSGSGDSGDTA